MEIRRGRPKEQMTKMRATFTLSAEAIKKGRELSQTAKKSLSQYIEDDLISSYDRFFQIKKLSKNDITKIVAFINAIDEMKPKEEKSK